MSEPIGPKMKVVVLGAQPEYLSGLRGPMIREMLAAGHAVTAIGAEEMPDVRAALESWGARYEVVPIRRAGIDPFADLKAAWILYRTFRRLKPDLVFAYTVKPIGYGLPIAWLAGIRRRYAMVAGRGFAFLPGTERRRRLARRMVSAIYRLGLRFADGILFQNLDDWDFFKANRLVRPRTRATRIFGSGVDLEQFQPAAFPEGPIVFLMISRLIADKGVNEYLQAARLLKPLYPDAVFRLVGPADPSPNGLSAEQIGGWQRDGIVDYVGPLADVRPAIAACHVYVLPSYAEGLPRSVLEAMAMGRPVVTTDAPGCRDTVVAGETGWLVPVKDVEALASAMETFIRDPGSVRVMGEAALAFARLRFDVRKVNRAILDFIGLGPAPP